MATSEINTAYSVQSDMDTAYSIQSEINTAYSIQSDMDTVYSVQSDMDTGYSIQSERSVPSSPGIPVKHGCEAREEVLLGLGLGGHGVLKGGVHAVERPPPHGVRQGLYCCQGNKTPKTDQTGSLLLSGERDAKERSD